MGQDQSGEDRSPSTTPFTLTSATLDGLAAYINSPQCRRIVTMSGAGISTSAGIPDFRSPKTGLYANLARLNLPRPEAVFDLSYFRQKPGVFYTLAHDLYPGSFRPTLAHAFVALLADKGLLARCFTQNIDCLERAAGVPPELVVEAHGSFAGQRCIQCKQAFPDAEMREHVAARRIPKCKDDKCGGLVKPNIVFFGEPLPSEFFDAANYVQEADLAIVMGSSLTVYPFASLPQRMRHGAPRLLLNNEIVGTLGSRPDDVIVLGDCDDGVRKLARACGWEDELMAKWAETAPKAEKKNHLNGDNLSEKTEKAKLSKDDDIEDKVNALTNEINDTLKLADDHKLHVEATVGRSNKGISNSESKAITTTKDEENSASKVSN